MINMNNSIINVISFIFDELKIDTISVHKEMSHIGRAVSLRLFNIVNLTNGNHLSLAYINDNEFPAEDISFLCVFYNLPG